MSFHIVSQKEGRRYGELITRNGVLSTPFFMPDATRASVRGVTPEELEKVGIEALVVNTYHLMLQPGEQLIARTNGVHQFMHWNRPTLSDSGGYQVYSLIHKNPEMGKITEEGAEFKSVLDGSKYLLTPERSIEIQFDLGVDMMVCLDDPRPNDAPKEEIVQAVDRTIRWAKRCKAEYEQQITKRGYSEKDKPLLFAVVQGGMIVEERKRCAEALIAIGFDGYGFGGRHIDEEGNFLEEILEKTALYIPEDKPRFALGIGTPSDIVRCHSLGWDMFDCVIPTREGRHGRLFVMNDKQAQCLISNPEFRINSELEKLEMRNSTEIQNSKFEFYSTLNINNEQFKEDFTPIDETCDCELCRNYTKAYLRHLFRVGEPLALGLASLHNLRFYARLMDRLKK